MLVYLSLAIVGLALLLISALFGHHDVDFHADIAEGGGGFLSIRAMAVFFLAFGTIGAIARHYGQSHIASSTWGILAGVLLVGVYLLSMSLVKSQQASSLVAEAELVGLTARVTVAIPAEGFGEVSCTMKAQTNRRMARAAHGAPIPEGGMVRIVEIQGDVCSVEPLS
jgi:membrane-bound ClpP family serine protease